MSLGGGTWTTQNKTMPGAYINYVSAQRAGITMADRGVCALPMELNWGISGKVFEVNAEELQNVFMETFGYDQTATEMLPVREVFRHAKTVYFYRLNGGGEKASCDISTAKYSGIRGNDIKHVISNNIDSESMFDVVTYLGTVKVDTQTVATAADLVDNKYVTFNQEASITITAGMNLTGGTNGEVTGAEHQAALTALEAYGFNVLGCMSEEEAIKSVYASYTKRLRDQVGAKFSLVAQGYAHDYIGTINLKNHVNDSNAPKYALVPWLAGAEAGCAINKTLDNMVYDGEYDIYVEYTQTELTKAIKAGELAFHRVGNSVNVLSDINSFVSVTKEMNEDFQLNQVIRVLDQVAIDVGNAFNTNFLGKVQNNEDGRIAFWSDCVEVHKEYQRLGAIEEFKTDDIVVSRGEGKRDVVEYEAIKPVCAMNKLYMTIEVS